MEQSEPKPWERQRGESPRAFAGFVLYRDLGAGRTIAEAARVAGRGRSTFSVWSLRWNWSQRAAAWDDLVDRRARDAALAEIEEAKRRHVNLAMALQGLGGKAVRRALMDDGLLLSPRDASLLIQRGVQIERLARGMPDTIVENRESDADAIDAEATRLLADPAFRGRLEEMRGGAGAGGDAGDAGDAGGDAERRQVDAD